MLPTDFNHMICYLLKTKEAECFEYGVWRPGYDIGGGTGDLFRPETAGKCQQKCTAVPACKYWQGCD